MTLTIRKKQVIFLLSYIVVCVLVKAANAEELKLAVASNFLKPMKTLVAIYEKETAQRVLISSGSTGKLYAQIIHGAPYDLFFAANTREPMRLEKSGHAIVGSRTTYAVGKIVLWSKNHNISQQTEIAKIFSDKSLKTLAIANPKTAPYGAAAMQVINNLNIPLQDLRVVQGENINQTFQFLLSSNVDFGFIAASQQSAFQKEGYFLPIPDDLYTPIEQQVVVLASSKHLIEAEKFLKFISRVDVKQQIAAYGYDLLNSSSTVTMK